jgi:hypothetical protein
MSGRQNDALNATHLASPHRRRRLLSLLLLLGVCIASLPLVMQLSFFAPPPPQPSLQVQRQVLDATVWKDEVVAQDYEAPFIELWDRLRAPVDKRAVLEAFAFELLRLGQAKAPRKLDHGMVEIEFSPGGQALDPRGWSSLLLSLEARGWELVQCEFHHSRFEPQRSRPARSVVSFALHAANGRDTSRAIVKGDLSVEWQQVSKQDQNALPKARIVDASNIRILYRVGAPLFTRRIAIGSETTGTNPNNRALLLVYDLDRNGLPEIVLPDYNVVYRQHQRWDFQRQPFLSDPPLTLKRPQRWEITAGVLADFTGDGLADFLGAGAKTIFLAPGDASGQFRQPVQVLAQPDKLAIASVVTAGDIDADGDLDIWLGQYLPPYLEGQMPTPYYDANDGLPAFLFRNDGNGHFTDVTEAAGLSAKRHRRTYSASFVDLDGDANQDLLVVSDFAGIDLYRNSGRGVFSDVSGSLVDQRHAFGMSHTLGDYNLDGRLDLYMIGMSSTTARRLDALGLARQDSPEQHRMRGVMGYGNRMYLAQGNRYVQASFNDSVARTGWSWGSTTFDYDNDADPDLFVANGHISRQTAKDYCTRFWCHDIYLHTSKPDPKVADLVSRVIMPEMGSMSWNGFEKDCLLMNESGRGFREVGFLMDVAFEFDSRNVVSCDLDLDGNVDLIVTEKRQDAAPVIHLLQNQGLGDRWIGVQLDEHGPGRSALGALVRAAAGSRTFVHRIVAGDSFQSQHPPQVHFGLGTIEAVDWLEVTWPDGTSTRLNQPAIRQYHRLAPPDPSAP